MGFYLPVWMKILQLLEVPTLEIDPSYFSCKICNKLFGLQNVGPFLGSLFKLVKREIFMHIKCNQMLRCNRKLLQLVIGSMYCLLTLLFGPEKSKFCNKCPIVTQFAQYFGYLLPLIGILRP